MVLKRREPLGNVSIYSVESHDHHSMENHRGQRKHIWIRSTPSRIKIHSGGSILGDSLKVKVFGTNGIVFDISLGDRS